MVLSDCLAHAQVHADELKSLVKIAQKGSVTSRNGISIPLDIEAKEDILWAIWRILVANHTTRIVFGDGNGFGLLLSVLEGVLAQGESVQVELFGDETPPSSSLKQQMEILDALLHVVTVGSAENPSNRNKLHDCISSQAFKRLLQKSRLVSAEYEQKLAELLFDVALERVQSPSQSAYGLPALIQGDGSKSFKIPGAESEMLVDPNQALQGALKEDVYNAGAIEVLLYFLLQFTLKLQLRILIQIERLVHVSPRNQNALTCAGKSTLFGKTDPSFLS